MNPSAPSPKAESELEQARAMLQELLGKHFYETQERAFMPGIADGWPKTIKAPHSKHGRLKLIETASLVPKLQAKLDAKFVSAKDWNALLLEIAKAYSHIDDEWADADLDHMDEFDPWEALRKIQAQLSSQQGKVWDRAFYKLIGLREELEPYGFVPDPNSPLMKFQAWLEAEREAKSKPQQEGRK